MMSDEEQDVDVYKSLTEWADEDHETSKIEFKFNPKDEKFYLPGDFSLPKSIFDNLFPHQKFGIQWLYTQWSKQYGCVLGDDMGLGKTVQVAVYLKGLFDNDLISKVLIVVPATLKNYWEEDLTKWCPDTKQII